METARSAVRGASVFRALSYRFTVDSDDAAVAHLIDDTFAGLREPPSPTSPGSPGSPASSHRYSLTPSPAGDGTVDVRRDGAEVVHDRLPGDAVGWVVGDVNRAAADASGQHLLFHAGALDADGMGVLVPGTSGSGKSTLVAGLVCAGLSYLTDELVAFDLSSGRLLPYAKPITIKPGSFGVLRSMCPSADVALPAAEWQVPVGPGTTRTIGHSCVPSLVVVPRYDAGAATAVTPLSDTDAFFYLALNAVNVLPHGKAGMATLGQLVADCTCVALSVSDLDAACALVLELVASCTARDGTATAGARG